MSEGSLIGYFKKEFIKVLINRDVKIFCLCKNMNILFYSKVKDIEMLFYFYNISQLKPYKISLI